MTESIYKRRVTTLRKRLGQDGLEAAWIVQPENRRFLSGFRADDTQITESSGSLFITASSCVLLTDSRYTTEAKAQATGYEVHTLKRGIQEGLPSFLKTMNGKKVGFEEDYVTVGLYQKMEEHCRACCPDLQFVPLGGMVEEMRLVKEPDEVTKLTRAADLMSEVIDEVVRRLRPGLEEREVAWMIEDLARKANADGLSFPSIVASGPNSALPHAVPTDRKLECREPIILDVGAKLEGYCSDMTRTVFLEGSTSEFREIYSTVRRAQLEAMKMIQPGVQSDHPDAVARKVIGDAGYGDYFGHGLGHGVGLATHEPPRLSPLNPVELKEGMVVTVEPGIYIPGKGGVRLEEMVVIETSGPRILTKNDFFYEFGS